MANERIDEATVRAKVVYSLCGEDIADRLEHRSREDIIEDTEVFNDLANYIKRRMDIPWEEYIDLMIDLYLEDNKDKVWS